MNDTKTREQEASIDDLVGLEDAIEQKQLLRGQRNENDPQGLYNKLKAEETAERAERVRNLTTGQKLLASVKEFLGRGVMHDYRTHVQKTEQFYAHMSLVSTNLEDKIQTIGKRKVSAEKQLIIDEAELQTNAVIVFHYERQLADISSRYEAARSSAVSRVPGTAQAMEDVQEITKLRQNLSEVHAENNRLAIRILSGREVTRNLGVQYDQVQRLYQQFEEQRVKAEGFIELARINDDALKGVADAKSINNLYKQAGVSIERLLAMQKDLKIDVVEKLSTDYRIRSPSANHKPVAGKQYWQTLDIFPGANGNGKN